MNVLRRCCSLLWTNAKALVWRLSFSDTFCKYQPSTTAFQLCKIGKFNKNRNNDCGTHTLKPKDSRFRLLCLVDFHSTGGQVVERNFIPETVRFERSEKKQLTTITWQKLMNSLHPKPQKEGKILGFGGDFMTDCTQSRISISAKLSFNFLNKSHVSAMYHYFVRMDDEKYVYRQTVFYMRFGKWKGCVCPPIVSIWGGTLLENHDVPTHTTRKKGQFLNIPVVTLQ